MVEEKWGVPPERIVDVLALVGDSVDNVPGVAGIGDKGARDLVREFGSLEAVLENADKVKRAAYREGLKAQRAEALLSKQLVTLRRDVPVELDLEGLRAVGPDNAAAHALFKELEFQALAREYAPELPNETAEHRLAATPAEVAAVVADARAASRLGLAVVVTSEQAMRAQPLGLALSWAAGPLGLRAARPLARSSCPQAIPRAEAVALLRPLLEDPAVAKVSAHAKRDTLVLERLGVTLRGLGFDALLARLPARSRAGAPTRSRTSRWSTSASAGRRAPTASPPRTRRPIPPRAPPAPRPSSCCGSSRRCGERLAREGLLEIFAVDGAAARRGARGHGARGREDRHGAPRAT